MKIVYGLLLGLVICVSAHADPDIFATIKSGRQTVTTAGTRVQLSTSSVPVKRVVITAETDNTNPVTVGGSDVIGALATRIGIPLTAGSSITVRANDLSNIWLDAITNTEGVTFVYYQ